MRRRSVAPFNRSTAHSRCSRKAIRLLRTSTLTGFLFAALSVWLGALTYAAAEDWLAPVVSGASAAAHAVAHVALTCAILSPPLIVLTAVLARLAGLVARHDPDILTFMPRQKDASSATATVIAMAIVSAFAAAGVRWLLIHGLVEPLG